MNLHDEIDCLTSQDRIAKAAAAARRVLRLYHDKLPQYREKYGPAVDLGVVEQAIAIAEKVSRGEALTETDRLIISGSQAKISATAAYAAHAGNKQAAAAIQAAYLAFSAAVYSDGSTHTCCRAIEAAERAEKATDGGDGGHHH